MIDPCLCAHPECIVCSVNDAVDERGSRCQSWCILISSVVKNIKQNISDHVAIVVQMKL
jgi:hypothetical protein